MTVAQLAKHIGMVFQNPNDQIFKKTVLDEVMFGPINIGMSKAEAKKKAEKALALVGMEDKISVNPYDLGLSERKLISIAAIVAMDTELMKLMKVKILFVNWQSWSRKREQALLSWRKILPKSSKMRCARLNILRQITPSS